MSRCHQQTLSLCVMLAAMLLAYSNCAEAQSAQTLELNVICMLEPVELGLAEPFAVLATNAVTDTMDSKIFGDMGTSTGTTLPIYAVPYPPGGPGLKGSKHPNDQTAIDARAAAINAKSDITGRSDCLTALGGVVELGGQRLYPGLYTSTSSMKSERLYLLFLAYHATLSIEFECMCNFCTRDLTFISSCTVESDDLILDAGMGTTGAVSNAVFIFCTPTTLAMTAGRKVILTGGATAKNIYWSAGTAATFAEDCIMQGNIFSGTEGITFAARCVHHGRFLHWPHYHLPPVLLTLRLSSSGSCTFYLCRTVCGSVCMCVALLIKQSNTHTHTANASASLCLLGLFPVRLPLSLSPVLSQCLT